jgi:vancomycin permeability regulator SanA
MLDMHIVIRSIPSFVTRVFLWLRLRAWWVVGIVGVLLVLISIAPVYAAMASRGEIYSAAAVPKHGVAIVFGAGVYPDGTPTPFLESRLLAAIQLYKTGKARVLLMSGDNRTSHYDEPTAMKKFAVAHGVPARAVVLDYAGYDTYDTCYRVHYLFGVNSAILVTHGYHLPRALMTCNKLGIKSVGVKADRANSSFSENYLLREVLSDNKAVVQLTVKPKPAVLGPKVDSLANALAQTKQ